LVVMVLTEVLPTGRAPTCSVRVSHVLRSCFYTLHLCSHVILSCFNALRYRSHVLRYYAHRPPLPRPTLSVIATTALRFRVQSAHLRAHLRSHYPRFCAHFDAQLSRSPRTFARTNLRSFAWNSFVWNFIPTYK
jgi:hypothetical protein